MVPPYRELASVSSSSSEILWEDNHVIVVFKPHRLLTQSDRSGDPSLMELTKRWLKERYRKPGNVYLGLVHRLDRPAAGIVLFAKTSKAAGRLSEQFRSRSIGKSYWAIIEGVLEPKSARLEHPLSWREGKSVLEEGGKTAVLEYRVKQEKNGLTLLEIELETGRKHQIRAQLSALGHPLLGDTRYGARRTYQPGAIALVAKELSFFHPVRRDERITVRLPDSLCPLTAFWR